MARAVEKALWFDLDGTLLTCRERQAGLAAYLVQEFLGKTLDKDRFWGLKRRRLSTQQALTVIYGDCPNVGEIAQAWVEEIEREQWLQKDAPVPDAMTALRLVKRLGLGVRILTARRNAGAVKDQVMKLGLCEEKELYVVSPLKPCLQKALILSSSRASSYIGDTLSDRDACRLAKIPFLAVCTGQLSKEILMAERTEVYENLLSAVTAAIKLSKKGGDNAQQD